MSVDGDGTSMLRNPWSRRAVILFLFLIPVAVSLFVYAQSRNNEFVWDDPIVLGQQLQAFHSLHDIFFPPPRIPQFGRLYYRPLIVLSYVFDRWAWGDTPWGFHVPVILFHALNAGFVFLVGRRLFGGLKNGLLAAVAAAVLFATHPIHTESVCWMAGRSDTLAAIFLLPALLAYFAWKRRSAWEDAPAIRAVPFGFLPPWFGRGALIGLASLLFLLGCLVKESALGLVFIIVAADLLGVGAEDAGKGVIGDGTRKDLRAARKESASLQEGARRKGGPGRGSLSPAGARQAGSGPQSRSSQPPHSRPKTPAPLPWSYSRTVIKLAETIMERATACFMGWVCLAVAGGVYFALRYTALAGESSSLRAQNPDRLESAAQLIRAVGFYVSKTFVPTHLDAFIPVIPSPGLSLGLGLLSLAAAAVLGWLAIRSGERLGAFLLAWFFGALAPSLAIAYFTISEAPVAERYLYLPSAGFCLAVAYLGLVKLPGLLFAGRSDSDKALLGTSGNMASSKPPVPPQPSAEPEARFGGAVSVVATCVAAALVVALAGAYAAGSVARERVWRTDLEFWKDGVAKSPKEGLPHLHLGLAYDRLDRKDLAEKEYRLAIDPAETDYDVEGRSTALNNLGMVYMGKGDHEQAENFFNQAITMRPDYATPYYGVGVTSLRRAEALYRNRQLSEAQELFLKSEIYLKHAIDLNPQYVKAHNQLAFLLSNIGRATEALGHINTVLRLVQRGDDHDFAASMKRQLEQSGQR